MENYLRELDEYFCSQYSDYTKLSAISGYEMPNMVVVDADGNLSRKDSSLMRLSAQRKKDELLAVLKEGLMDTDFTFSFTFRTSRDRMSDMRRKYTFAKILPAALKHAGETVESAGEKLDIEPRFWSLIAKGKVYPEKNTVFALGLACRLQEQDFKNLLAVCGFKLDEANVRDVVVGYLMHHKIFNETMRDRCLAEYKITSLPLKKAQ